MKLLLHQCCGPCSIYPISSLQKMEGVEITAYFYNPNIHPMQEFYRRMESAAIVNNRFGIDYIIDDQYGLIEFTRSNALHETRRCKHCYSVRIQQVAAKAKELNFNAFSSTLLYSKMQDHELIKAICEKESEKTGINFYYEDFREGWQEGIDISKTLEIYRQNYCGCIYSEEDRFKTVLPKKFAKTFPLVKISDKSSTPLLQPAEKG